MFVLCGFCKLGRTDSTLRCTQSWKFVSCDTDARVQRRVKWCARRNEIYLSIRINYAVALLTTQIEKNLTVWICKVLGP
jgi:hypothetical protein